MFEMILVELVMLAISLIGMFVSSLIYDYNEKKRNAIKHKGKKTKAKERLMVNLFGYSAFIACVFCLATAIMLFIV